MKKLIPIFLIFSITGCAAMLPSVQSQHPIGYEKLIIIIPECRTSNLDNYGACLDAASMLESSSSQKATIKFIANWEETAFGMAARNQHAGETAFPLDPSGGAMNAMVWGKVHMDAIRAEGRIVLPVLKKIYSDNNEEYSHQMLKHLDLIILTSKSSFDTFREMHIKYFSP